LLDLDRSSPVPLYFQVAQQIEQAIERGDLGPGMKLENEIELADRFGLSRPTMRRAIQELVSKGLLVRKQGVGTQVVHGQVKRSVELTSLYDDLSRTNQKPTTQRYGSACRSARRPCTSNGCASPTTNRWRSCATGCPPAWPASPPPIW